MGALAPKKPPQPEVIELTPVGAQVGQYGLGEGGLTQTRLGLVRFKHQRASKQLARLRYRKNTQNRQNPLHRSPSREGRAAQHKRVIKVLTRLQKGQHKRVTEAVRRFRTDESYFRETPEEILQEGVEQLVSEQKVSRRGGKQLMAHLKDAWVTLHAGLPRRPQFFTCYVWGNVPANWFFHRDTPPPQLLATCI